jgi:integrase
MKGSMRQRGSAWELRVYLGADPVTGKQRYATKTVRAGKREAQRLLNEMKVEAERGLATRTTATVGEPSRVHASNSTTRRYVLAG